MFFDDGDLDDFAPLPTKRARRFEGTLKRLEYPLVHRSYALNPFAFSVGDEVTLDTECFKNYWLAGFKHINSGQYFYIEKFGEGSLSPGQIDALKTAMYWFKLHTFNGRNYDMPMIEAAVHGATLEGLKELSDAIILRDERRPNPLAKYNHVDLIEVCPLEGSLKLYAARLHCKRMQEIPINPHAAMSLADVPIVRDYCFNDLDNTELILNDPKHGLRAAIELRERLGQRYGGIDLRSKSDAQVAEAVINAELKKITGRYPKRPEFPENFAFKYDPPEWVSFQTQQLRDMLETVEAQTFHLDAGGKPQMPEAIGKLSLRIGDGVYKMGMGGLHSQEKSVGCRATEENVLIDTDVAGYYPRIILNNEYYPEHLGLIYLQAYGGIVELRLQMKNEKNPDADGLKIAVNGTFGKQGNQYSTIFAPKLLIQTTMTGQLGLLMLIEAMELARFEVISANTDGFVVNCPRARYDEFISIVRMWEQWTRFQTEETRYAALYSRDVNNYIAVKEDGTCKTKGTYCERGSALNSPLSKNPEMLICSDAVQAFLTKGALVEDTIRTCRDIRRFVVVRNVKGGAHKDGYYLGKVVRWYYAYGVRGAIRYILSGNQVSNSEGAKPLMELGEFPDDLNFEYYIDKAYAMLSDIGYYQRSTQPSFF